MRVLCAAALTLLIAAPAAAQAQSDSPNRQIQLRADGSSYIEPDARSYSDVDSSGINLGNMARDKGTTYVPTRRNTRAFRSFDWDSPDPATGGYFADDYAGYGPDPETLGGSDRVYRGRDGRYYCRRYDASTQPLDQISDKMLGEALPVGGSALLRTIANPVLTAIIKRRQVRCGV